MSELHAFIRETGLKAVCEQAEYIEKLIMASHGRYCVIEYHDNGIPKWTLKLPYYALIIRWLYRKDIKWPYEYLKKIRGKSTAFRS